MNPADPAEDGPPPGDPEANRGLRPDRRMRLRAATIRKILWLSLNLALLQASDIQLPELPGFCGQVITQTRMAILEIGACFYQF